MREELFWSFPVILILISILINFGSSDTHKVNKRSTDSSYYNSYSRPEYNTKSHPRQLTSSSTGAYYDQEEFGNYAAAGSHGGHYSSGGGYGGGHGGGGHSGGYGKGNNVNSSAVGLLGFLALLSLIQNVLRQMTTTVMNMTGRRRRDTELDMEPADMEMDMNFDLDMGKHTWSPSGTNLIGDDDSRITKLILPMLTAVAHARDGLVPHRCVYKPLCKANRLLVHELGDHGASIGIMITKAVGKLLSVNDKSEPARNSLSKMTDAGKHGRIEQRQCDSYEHCDLLNNLPVYGLPPSGFF